MIKDSINSKELVVICAFSRKCLHFTTLKLKINLIKLCLIFSSVKLCPLNQSSWLTCNNLIDATRHQTQDNSVTIKVSQSESHTSLGRTKKFPAVKLMSNSVR